MLFKYILILSLSTSSYALFESILGNLGGHSDNNCKEICAQTCKIIKPKYNDIGEHINNICMKWGKEEYCFNDILKKTEECLKENKNKVILCSKLEGFFDPYGDKCQK